MADEQQDEQEKSQEATPQKLQKAREKGDVPVSTETHTAAAYMGLLVSLLFVGGVSVDSAGARLKSFLARPETYLQESLSGELIFAAAISVGLAMLPILLFPALGVIISLFAQQAFVFAPSKIGLKWNKLSIASNAKQKYGPKGMAEFARSVLKLTFVLSVAGVVALGFFEDLPGLAKLEPALLGGALLDQALGLITLFVLSAAIIGGIDLPWRRFEHAKRNRMSFDELKRENKETEGDPYMKSARRERARAIAQQQQMLEVPKADVVLVNPTHYAVALKWDQERGGAPVVVAKGVDEVARRIREIAAEAGVPIKRDPPVTRSIYELVDLGEEIRREHYAAVATAIHFAEDMRRKARQFKWGE